MVSGVAPTAGGSGSAINVTGANLSGAVAIRFMQGQGQPGGSAYSALAQALQGGPAGTCSVTASAPGWAACASAPSLPAGQYSLVIESANGDWSVGPAKVCRTANTKLCMYLPVLHVCVSYLCVTCVNDECSRPRAW